MQRCDQVCSQVYTVPDRDRDCSEAGGGRLQDRHNGNILLDDAGHLIHIDFGFMLSNSPGGVNFEAAPFKLTRELLEIMDSSSEGQPSEMFDYYKVRPRLLSPPTS